KMELFSPRFREAVLEAFNSAEKVLATVMLASSPFTDGLKSRAGVKLIVLDRHESERVLEEVVTWLRGTKSGMMA
ncbi:MAG: nucleoside-triphosphatase, partial [Dehalococcoidia bacterium]|nr:nucleoside-triphosphatase [Dehalococcoidia bacterium]